MLGSCPVAPSGVRLAAHYFSHPSAPRASPLAVHIKSIQRSTPCRPILQGTLPSRNYISCFAVARREDVIVRMTWKRPLERIGTATSAFPGKHCGRTLHRRRRRKRKSHFGRSTSPRDGASTIPRQFRGSAKQRRSRCTAHRTQVGRLQLEQSENHFTTALREFVDKKTKGPAKVSHSSTVLAPVVPPSIAIVRPPKTLGIRLLRHGSGLLRSGARSRRR